MSQELFGKKLNSNHKNGLCGSSFAVESLRFFTLVTLQVEVQPLENQGGATASEKPLDCALVNFGFFLQFDCSRFFSRQLMLCSCGASE